MTPLLRAGVVIPISPADEYRRRNYERVRAHLEELDWPIVGGVSLVDPFSPSQARNNGAAMLPASTVDVLYFNDADSVVELDQIRAAVALAAAAPGLVFAFEHYVRTNEDGRPTMYVPNSGSSGAVAISRACFDEVGGYDERFVGWGYEDLAFAFECSKRWPVRRVPGQLVHLWHPPAGVRTELQRDVAVTSEQQTNLALYESIIRG
jgi:hypothetical protein